MRGAPAADLQTAARAYLRRGWFPVPVPAGGKKPVLPAWQRLRLLDDELEEAFPVDGNIGLILGEASGWLVDVDLDCDEAIELADDYLPPTDAVTGRPGKPRSHRWYIAEGARTTQRRDPVTRAMVVELRSTGGQTLVGPSIHPDSGEQYQALSGEPAQVSAVVLTESVARLAQAVLARRGRARMPTPNAALPPAPSTARDDQEAVECRALAYLERLPPAISGQGGHGATYTAATVIVHGFGIDPDRALSILLAEYNPRCDPPWSEKELRHKVEDAASKDHDRPRGWLRDTPLAGEAAPDVDISGILKNSGPRPRSAADPPLPASGDPGPTPPELLRIPGFVSEVMDHCLATAPYPNLALAFCGAVSLQAFLAGRKVRDAGDNRSNIYILGLAYSAAGKDWPRKINTKVLHAIGLAGSLGDRFASGEGLQDALFVTPSMLFQTDEIDGLLQSISKSHDARFESLLGTLLTMFSSANSLYPMRRKAGKEPAGVIDQPCLVLCGTATPTCYYEALSERLLTNGLFARMIIVEGGPRSQGQEPGLSDPPARLIETARWWAEFQPGRGDLQNCHPEPRVIQATAGAREALLAIREDFDREYSKAEAGQDSVGTTVWGRAWEHTRKLALIYAVSTNHLAPVIDEPAIVWASQFVTHHIRRMLFMAAMHVADNEFHRQCLRFLKKLAEAPDRTLSHSQALKRMKMDSQLFQKLIRTLYEQGDIDSFFVQTTGRSGIHYRLLSAGEHRVGSIAEPTNHLSRE